MMYLMRTPLVLLSLLSLSTLTLAEKKIKANACGVTCSDLLIASPYADCNQAEAESWELGCFCSSNVLAESFALCIDTYCDGSPDIYSELSKALCGVDNFNGVKYAAALEAGEKNEVHFGTFNTSLPVEAPYVWPAPIFDPLYRTTSTLFFQLKRGEIYGGLMVAFLGFFIVLAMLRTAAVKVLYFSRLPRQALSARPSKLTRLIQQYIVYPAMFSGKHINRPKIFGVYLSLPTRAQSLIIAGYLTIGFVCQFMSYQGQFFAENKFFGADSRTQLTEYVAARAGIMAFMQLPFVFLFGGRNNFMITLTGWSYSTFNVYHRWCSRTMWALAMIHGVTYTINAAQTGRFQSAYTEAFWCWGVSAVTIAGFIMFQAVYNFRKLAYEAFLVVHIVLVIAFVVALWYHSLDNGYMNYLYCSIAVWAFDRFVRLLRVIYFNFGFSGTTSAEIRVIGEENYSLLQIKLRTTRKVVAKPGQYLFLHVGRITPWQSHPFSILDQDETGAYVLVAKVHKGLTCRLHNHVLDNRSGKDAQVSELAYDAPTRNIRAGIDGLYGGSAPVDLYDTALLVAGGAGITGVYPYLKHIVRNESAVTRHVKLIWSVRHTSTMSWLQPQLEAVRELAKGRVALDIHMYVSSGPETSETSSQAGDLTPSDTESPGVEKVLDIHHSNEHLADDDEKREDGETPGEDDLHRVTSVVVRTKRPSDDFTDSIPVFYQRPDLTRIVTEVVGHAPSSTGVLVCGPGAMADELRAAVCGNIEAAKGRLDYFEEAFEW